MRVKGFHIGLFLSIALLQLAWAVAMPMTSGPDEPAHMYRSASLWQGDLLPDEQSQDGTWWVEVPANTRALAESSECFRHRFLQAADCTQDAVRTGRHDPVHVKTGAGRYAPLYYWAVGPTSLLRSADAQLYGMRIVSLMGAALLLTVTISTLLTTLGRVWTGIALAAALTPQVIWLNSTVNPNSWEICGALLAWTSGLALLTRRDPAEVRGLVVKFTVGCTVLLGTRRLSTMWLCAILFGLLLAWTVMPATARARLVTYRAYWPVAVWLSVLALVSVWWHLTFDLAPVSAVMHSQDSMPVIQRAQESLDQFPQWMRQIYGLSGWLDTMSPRYPYYCWLLTIAVLGVASLRAIQPRARAAASLAVLVAISVAIPVAFETAFGSQLGQHYWQARYTMPFSQGLFLVAVFLAHAWLRASGRTLDRRWAVVLLGTATVMWAGHVLTFVSALHRYTSGKLAPWSVSAIRWEPPGGISVDVAIAALAVLGICWWTLRSPVPVSASRVELPADQDDPVGETRQTSPI